VVATTLGLCAHLLLGPGSEHPGVDYAGSEESGFSHYQFLAFWAIHLLVVWAAIYLTWGRRLRPEWRSYRIAVVVSVVWAAVTFTFNSIAGTNYGFINKKPATATLLDLLGPWPVYVLTAATLILIVWALMTLPWQRTRRHPKEGL
jgi:hypothetical integral membrane protein (TIGR02206 family)